MITDAERNERLYDKQSAQDNDTRTPAQKDRDRILHSEALRRLANVTQVVDPAEGHVYHNRLTHTLKVAQIARRLAENVLIKQPSEANILKIDPDVVEAAALAHDLGHPPFGHIAERELDSLVRAQGLPDGYEGNPQSFRILTKLEIRTHEFHGLDLTRATLNAVLKYPRLRGLVREKNRKWGAYTTEENEFEWVRRGSTIDLRSVEAEIMDWADDIAFSVHDVEDFYRAGLIPPIIFSKEPPQQELDAYLHEIIPHWTKDRRDPVPFQQIRSEILGVFHEFRELLPFSEPFRNTPESFGKLRSTTSYLIEWFIRGFELNPVAVNNPTVRTSYVNPDLRNQVRLLKGLTWRYVIHNQALATQQYGKRKVIRELFLTYMGALTNNDKDDEFILPEDYRDRIESIESDLESMEDEEQVDPQVRRKQACARLAADIISSMNDQEALVMYKRLNGMEPGSVHERIPH